MATAKPIIVIKKRRPRRPSRRCVEGRLCRLRHRDDGSLHRPLAPQLQSESTESRRRLLLRPQRHRRNPWQRHERRRRKFRPHQRQYGRNQGAARKNHPRSPRFRKAQKQYRHDRHQRGPAHRDSPNPPAAPSSTVAARKSAPTAPNSSARSLVNSANSPTPSPWKVTPTPSPILPPAPTPTGSFPPIAPTPPA